jgi:hypothetical protein
MTAMTGAFLLPEDVLVFPAGELAADVREKATSSATDFVVTRPNARQASTIVDEKGAALLKSFRMQRTIIIAVIEFSRERGLEPQHVLGEAFPLLSQLIGANILVPAGSHWANRIVASLQAGDIVEGWTVEQTIHLVEDTEVHRVRNRIGDRGALKIARRGYESILRHALRHEARILDRLSGGPAPKLIDVGDRVDPPFLVLEWCDGTPSIARAQQLIRDARDEARSRLLKICIAILDAYTQVHDSGVLHGDVHPNNVLLTDDDTVRIIDFGRARAIDDRELEDGVPRGGAAFYYDPQLAGAMLAGVKPPPAAPSAEQYCIAVLLRELLVGRPYLDFSLDQRRMLEQIVEDRPKPFARDGVPQWPGVERVLSKALSKDPAERFATLREFADALAKADPPSAPAPVVGRAPPELFSEVMSKLARDGADFAALRDGAAMSSVNNGAAGVAYALYRIACLREDPATFALAELWIAGAERRVGDDDAFYRSESGLAPEIVGRASLFYSPVGVACVDALIALALDDGVRATRAVESFLARSRNEDSQLDLAFGRSGRLLGCATLLAALPPHGYGEARAAVHACGDALDASLREALQSLPAMDDPTVLNLGIAHGWAGALFSLLRWREACRRGGADPKIEAYTNDLVSRAEPRGEGLRWPWLSPGSRPGAFMPGWCNGSAGFVHLMNLAERSLGSEEFGRIARRAAINAHEEPAEIADLCCGAAGRAYAMLDMFRHTGEKQWLERARALGQQAVELTDRGFLARASLYKGEVGVALLFVDLDTPELSCMPLFDAEP